MSQGVGPLTWGAMKNWRTWFEKRPFVSVVRLEGAIGMGRRGLSDVSTAGMIERAFRGKPKAVALVINSPGGSPVQSSLIAARITRLSKEKDVPVFAFVEDVAASGGYWLASAADHIYADPGSVLGSIGVISASFGLSEAIGRYGIERRVHTAGESKSFMDPFRPEDPADVARLNEVLEQLHTVFIDQIKSRRAERLDPDAPLFTGQVWLGQRAVDVGLADGIAHVVPEMKRRFGPKVKFRRHSPRRPFAARFGLSMARDVAHVIDEKAAYARFGL